MFILYITYLWLYQLSPFPYLYGLLISQIVKNAYRVCIVQRVSVISWSGRQRVVLCVRLRLPGWGHNSLILLIQSPNMHTHCQIADQNMLVYVHIVWKRSAWIDLLIGFASTLHLNRQSVVLYIVCCKNCSALTNNRDSLCTTNICVLRVVVLK